MSLRRIVARMPGAVAVTRVVKNQYQGVRQRLHLDYDVDGVTHRRMTLGESVEYVRRVVDDYLAFGGLHARELWGRTVLEIGPGDSLGVALVLAGLGTRRVVAVDRFRTFRNPEKERRILASLIERAEPSARELMRRCLGEDGLVAGETIRYRPETPIERLAGDAAVERFDYIISRSVLEHVFDLEGTYRSCRRLVRDGGLMVHKVDLSNHSAVESHPLQFLTYSERLWRLMSSNISRINRARWPHHRTALERNGFVVERFAVTKRLPPEEVATIRPRLAPEFRQLADEELAIYGFFMACRAV